jgi:hypothetical protein
MSNHIHLEVQQKDGKLSDWVRDFKKFTSKKLVKMILENLQESRRKWLEMIYDQKSNEVHSRESGKSGNSRAVSIKNTISNCLLRCVAAREKTLTPPEMESIPYFYKKTFHENFQGHIFFPDFTNCFRLRQKRRDL